MARQHKKKRKTATQGVEGVLTVARNRRLRHEYEILDSFEVGIVLAGSEVKSLRAGDIQWPGAHARIEDGEVWLYELYIGQYRQASVYNHATTRQRKLLLHRQQIDRLIGKLRTKGVALIPEDVHFRRGHAKLRLCLVRGKKRADKRRDMIDREKQRDAQRELARRGR